jgi:hypothetical protein
MVRQLVSTMNLSDITALSKTNKKMASQLINSPVFWKERIKKDYNITTDKDPKLIYVQTRKDNVIHKKIKELEKSNLPVEVYTYLSQDDVIDYLMRKNRNYYKKRYERALDISDNSYSSIVLKAVNTFIKKYRNVTGDTTLSLRELDDKISEQAKRDEESDEEESDGEE